MKKHGKILFSLAALLSAVTLFTAGCELFGGGATQNSGSGTDNGNNNSNNNGSGNQQQEEEQEELPEFESRSGTDSDPYIIAQPYQWKNINKYLSAYYELDADLNMGDTEINSVGNSSTPFSGNFDGKGHKVHSATVTGSLFGVVSEGTVKNLNFENSQLIKAVSCFFGIVKMGALVENCHARTITVSDTVDYYSGNRFGGIASTVASAANVLYCSADMVVTCSCQVGIVIGKVEGGHVDSCWVTGSIKSSGSSITTYYGSIGGIVGTISNGSVTNCFSQCSVNYYGSDILYIADERTGGQMDFCLSFNDFSASRSYYGHEKKMFYKSSVNTESTILYYSPDDIEYANNILGLADWQSNRLWKKGKLHPELVSYEEYLQIKAQ